LKIFALENKKFNLREKFDQWLETILIQTELKQLQFKYQFD